MTHCETREVTTRKQHNCCWCWGIIEKGEQCNMHEGFSDDGPFCVHTHTECERASRALLEKYPSDWNEIVEAVGNGFERGHCHEPGWGFTDYCPGCLKEKENTCQHTE